jgi:SAM-dependent methyltransferase
MREPFRTQFAELVRRGAATVDIHERGVVGEYTEPKAADDALVEREIGRMELHRRGSVAFLERVYHGDCPTILDVGCSTGGTTVALALSKQLAADRVVGVDPNHAALEAARVRARGHGVPPERIVFHPIGSAPVLPFPAERFELVVCVSVLEYLASIEARAALVREMLRVTRRGGFIMLATPSARRLRDYHTRRWFGRTRRRPGSPWLCTPRELHAMLAGCELIDTRLLQIEVGMKARGMRVGRLPRWARHLAPLLPWHKVVARVPTTKNVNGESER